jgi:hypothetical protein
MQRLGIRRGHMNGHGRGSGWRGVLVKCTVFSENFVIFGEAHAKRCTEEA